MATRRSYDCPNCGTFPIEQSIKEDVLTTCPICEATIKRNLKADADGLYYELDPFMEELLRPEYKAKGRRWTQEHKIKGLDY